ncbi:MAG: excisionase [Pseudomonadota bacterium]
MTIQPPAAHPADYITVELAEIVTGLSKKAIYRKIEDGKWVEGREFRYSPDGGVFIYLPGYYKWVESGQGSRRARRASASSSCSTARQSASA